jgi:oxygen-dependent protoporphyrinogen oxidase
MAPQSPVLIIGGGISGLAAAYYLAKSGIRSTILENSGRLGGLIATERISGCILEAGPDSYLASKPAATGLALSLGLEKELSGTNDFARRIYIVRHGKLVPLPRGMSMMVPAEWTPALASELFSFKTKLRLLGELVYRPQERASDVSVREFVCDHFGDELAENVAEPLLAGVYGGSAAALSAASVLPRFVAYEREYGSLIRAVRRERRHPRPAAGMFQSLRSGMGDLIAALEKAIEAHTNIVCAQAEHIARSQDCWQVEASGTQFLAPELILACPAHVSAHLLSGAAPALASELAAIPYSSAVLVTLAYRAAEVLPPLNGFGFLVPRAERKTIAAATFVHRKFPSRIPPELAVLRAFIVDPEAGTLLNASHDSLIRLVNTDFQNFLGIRAVPLFARVHRWPDSMPQYVVGHQQRRNTIGRLQENVSGLSLIGNAFDGVGVPDCIRLAEAAAQHIRTRVHTAAPSEG